MVAAGGPVFFLIQLAMPALVFLFWGLFGLFFVGVVVVVVVCEWGVWGERRRERKERAAPKIKEAQTQQRQRDREKKPQQHNNSRLARASVVRDQLAVHEPLERWVAADAKLLGHLGLHRRVDLANHHGVVKGLDGRGGLGVLGLEALLVLL